MRLNTKKFNKKQNIIFPGYYEYQKIELVNNSKSMDLIPLIAQLDIFESIWSVTMTGHMTIMDTENLIESFPIVGEETLNIQIKDSNDARRYSFHITQITDRTQIKNGGLSYILHFASEEAFADSFQRVSKSFYQKPYETNVETILEDYLQTKKKLHLAETDGPRCVVIPHWSPLYACSWLANRSQSIESKYQDGNFIFYENQSGFYFVSLENLFDSKENTVYCDFEPRPLKQDSQPIAVNDKRYSEAILQFENWQVVKTFDILDNIKSGMYANRIFEFNLSTRKIKTKNFNYNQQFDEQVHLKGKNGIKGQQNNSVDFVPNVFPEAQQRVVINHKGLFNDEPVGGSSNINNWITEKISQTTQMNNQIITGQLPGHFGLEAGMIVNFYVPRVHSIVETDRLEYDAPMSGEYLITSLRRTFQKDKFWLSIELIKDSRGSSV